MRNVRYEVWAFGFDKENFCTDIEKFLAAFDTPDAAIEYAKKFKDISYLYGAKEREEYLEAGDYLQIVVETLENTDPTNINIDTIYENFIY